MHSLKGKTILIVDDDVGYRDLLGDEFSSLDANVLLASAGAEAFDIVSRMKVDAVVSDIRMAGGSGIEFLDKSKAFDTIRPVVILISGFSDISPEDAYERGAEALFIKPFSLETLVESVYLALLPERERWLRNFEYSPDDFNVEIGAESLVEAIKKRTVNIGRGGLFIPLDNPPNKVNKRVTFSIKTSSTGATAFEGVGICRWLRTNDEFGLPQGMGIEVCKLTPNSINAFVDLIEELKPKQFIPKQLKAKK